MPYLWISIAWTLFAGAALAVLIQRHRGLKALQPMIEGPDTWPSLTVVIPTRNEETNIKTCLKSMLQQTYPLDRLSILVVDDSSTDQTRKIVAALASEYTQIRLIDAG